MPSRVVRRTYGTRRAAPGPAVSSIFGTESVKPEITVSQIADALANVQLEQELEDSVAKAQFSDEEDGVDEEHEEPEIEKTEDDTVEKGDTSTVSQTLDHGHQHDCPEEFALLANAIQADSGHALLLKTWSDILPSSYELTKIAEASFAEVYRVATSEGTSILKVMQLKSAKDPESQVSDTANTVQSVLSEIRIMNTLADVPGFVIFKEAHIVQGAVQPLLTDAWSRYLEEREEDEEYESYFPDPSTYNPNSAFLVIELADAGFVLEDYPITSINIVWDVLLGVVMALSRAEISNEFEHRDLHENNVCVTEKHEPTERSKTDGPVRFGYSGTEITIIDYGLSRATLNNGDIAFNDLEEDLALFHGTGSGLPSIQYDNYRRMRNHLFTGTRTMQKRAWHTPASRKLNDGHTWAEYTPWSNVLWVRYLLAYLNKTYKQCDEHCRTKKYLLDFEKETKELMKRLDLRTSPKNGAFETATDIMTFVLEQQWVTDEQLEGYGVDTTFFSDASRLD